MKKALHYHIRRGILLIQMNSEKKVIWFMRFSTLAPEVRSENTFKAKYLAYGLIMQFFSLAVSRLFAPDR